MYPQKLKLMVCAVSGVLSFVISRLFLTFSTKRWMGQGAILLIHISIIHEQIVLLKISLIYHPISINSDWEGKTLQQFRIWHFSSSKRLVLNVGLEVLRGRGLQSCSDFVWNLLCIDEYRSIQRPRWGLGGGCACTAEFCCSYICITLIQFRLNFAPCVEWCASNYIAPTVYCTVQGDGQC